MSSAGGGNALNRTTSRRLIVHSAPYKQVKLQFVIVCQWGAGAGACRLTVPRNFPAMHLASNRSRQDAVLLLHGLSGSPLEMQYLERCARQAGFRAHNPSIPGCGMAGRKHRFDTGVWRQWVDFAAEQLDALSREHERVYVSGLCVGAVLALRLAIERPQQVAGLALVSTTLAFDGWRMPWYRVLAPLGWHTPLRRRIAWPERHPYGLKNERLRQWVLRAWATGPQSGGATTAAGAAYLPLSGIHEAHQLIRAVRRDIAQVRAPTLVLHAIEDDVASPSSASFVALNIRSSVVRTILYHNSYHILTLDNDKQSVADETIGFFRGPAGAGAARSDEHGEGVKPKLFVVA